MRIAVKEEVLDRLSQFRCLPLKLPTKTNVCQLGGRTSAYLPLCFRENTPAMATTTVCQLPKVDHFNLATNHLPVVLSWVKTVLLTLNDSPASANGSYPTGSICYPPMALEDFWLQPPLWPVFSCHGFQLITSSFQYSTLLWGTQNGYFYNRFYYTHPDNIIIKYKFL